MINTPFCLTSYLSFIQELVGTQRMNSSSFPLKWSWVVRSASRFRSIYISPYLFTLYHTLWHTSLCALFLMVACHSAGFMCLASVYLCWISLWWVITCMWHYSSECQLPTLFSKLTPVIDTILIRESEREVDQDQATLPVFFFSYQIHVHIYRVLIKLGTWKLETRNGKRGNEEMNR